MPEYSRHKLITPDGNQFAPLDARIDLAGKRPSEVMRILTQRIEQLDRETDSRYALEYSSASGYRPDGTKDDSPIRDRYRWTAIFPVTGGSEGHYLHLVCIYQYDEQQKPYAEINRYREIGTIKLFGGWDAAAELAGIIGRWIDA